MIQHGLYAPDHLITIHIHFSHFVLSPIENLNATNYELSFFYNLCFHYNPHVVDSVCQTFLVACLYFGPYSADYELFPLYHWYFHFNPHLIHSELSHLQSEFSPLQYELSHIHSELSLLHSELSPLGH